MEYKKEPPIRREDLEGTWAMQRVAERTSKQREVSTQLALEWGLESADLIRDRKISLFDRDLGGFYGGERFMGIPFLEDTHMLGVIGIPFLVNVRQLL